ncbi:MAG: DUF58 domain-containing protein [Steroidobacteraceae bacterium]|nr:DUF58 domain-containing protein [Steroidobacteraceae bacterium]
MAAPRAWLARRIASGEARAARWVRRRQGEDRLPVELGRRRLYILPTRAGAGFAVLLLAMLLAGLNYSNSLALLLTFVLGGFAIVGMNQCHRNLLGLRVTTVHLQAAFAGEAVVASLAIDNPGVDRFDLAAEVAGASVRLARAPQAGSVRLELRLPAPRRGRLRLGRLRIATRFPFGLFRCWTWLHLPLDALVYPRPAGALPLPVGPAGRDGSGATADAGRDELRDLRPFRDGDSPRQVAWKAYARGQPLLVKEYAGAATESLRLDFDALPGLEVEARLSQLCRWALEAEARGQRYALHLPGAHLEADRGGAHLGRCLAALALHPGAHAEPGDD